MTIPIEERVKIICVHCGTTHTTNSLYMVDKFRRCFAGNYPHYPVSFGSTYLVVCAECEAFLPKYVQPAVQPEPTPVFVNPHKRGPVEMVCEYCGKHYMSKRPTMTKYCSNSCNTMAHRARQDLLKVNGKK